MYFNILVQTEPLQRWTVRQQVLVHFQVTKVLRNGHTSALSTGMITKSSWVSVETIPFYGSKALTTGYKWICSPYKRPYKWVITPISRVGFWGHLEPCFNMFFSKHLFHQRKNFAASEHPSDPAMYTKTKPFTLPPQTPWVPNERRGRGLIHPWLRTWFGENLSTFQCFQKKMDGCRISMEFFQSKNHGFTKLFFLEWKVECSQQRKRKHQLN